jgi:ubiquinone/menaquinone biosynthesis C-methylase UbiE
MTLSARRGPPRSLTPHLSGGENLDKVDWEMGYAPESWEVMQPFVRREEFTDKEVLDVGCGWGGKAIYLAETTKLLRIHGYDIPGIFDPAVPTEVARERGLDRCTFATGYAEDIPASDSSFDIVLIDDVFEHVRDPDRVILEIARVLRPRGLLIARFPSIRMLRAHHFDRALTYPGLHYLMPMQKWAAGFNHYLLHNDRALRFDPFPEVVRSWSGRRLTENLNGLDLARARQMVEGTGLELRTLSLVPYPRSKFGRAGGLFRVYRALRAIRPLREPLSRTIVLIAVKSPDSSS